LRPCFFWWYAFSTMRKPRFFWLAIFFIPLALAMAINQLTQHSETKVLLVRPPENIQRMTFGYDELLSDLLWIRVIQNFDSCGKDGYVETRDYSKGVKLNDLEPCNYSWVYQMIRAITDLSPEFYTAYYYGGLNLSYLVRDIEGAKEIYNRGIERFPGNVPLLFSAAYHMLAEVKDESAAAVLLLRAAKAGAPSHIMDIATKLFSKEGRRIYAENQLKAFIANLDEDDPFRKKLESRLEALRLEISKERK
jgi:hypothetical protein